MDDLGHLLLGDLEEVVAAQAQHGHLFTRFSEGSVLQPLALLHTEPLAEELDGQGQPSAARRSRGPC